jgi:hypothetical protein
MNNKIVVPCKLFEKTERMTECKLKRSPRINSKKIYWMIRDSGNPEDVEDGVAVNFEF